MDEVRADPVELSGLASATLAVATTMTGGWRGAQLRVRSPEGHDGLRQATAVAASAADTAVRRVLDVFAADADRLWRTAFAYEEADERARFRWGARP